MKIKRWTAYRHLIIMCQMDHLMQSSLETDMGAMIKNMIYDHLLFRMGCHDSK